MRFTFGHLKLAALATLIAWGASGCAEKGSGKGTRQRLPDFSTSGTARDDGTTNQKPKTPGGRPDNSQMPGNNPTPTPTPTPNSPLLALRACMKAKIDEKEVASPPLYADQTKSLADSNAICTALDKSKWADGVKGVAPVDTLTN